MLSALGNRDEAQRRAAEGQKLARSLFDAEVTGREVAIIYAKILAREARSQ